MSKQVNLFPDRAATFVVHPTPGIGDATTIQEALDMLPVGGGAILVREGTYSISATITLPAAKPVTIRGLGNNTIISLGANAIPAFTIPTGYTTNTPVVFDNFLVTGTEVANQAVLEYADANGLAEIYIQNMDTTGVQKTINVTASSSGSTTPGQDNARFHMLYCRIRPISTDNSIILNNPSLGVPKVWMKEVEFIGDSLFAIPALRTAPLFGRIADDFFFGDVTLDSCTMSVGGAGTGGESDFNTFECFNSTIWNNDNVNLTVTYLLFGASDGLNPGAIRDSACRGIYFEAEAPGINFFSNWLQDCPIQLFGAGCVIGDNQIIEVQNPWVGGVTHPYGIKVNNENSVIRNNRFKFQQTTPAQTIDLEVATTITGNDFSECHPPSNGTILINSGDAIITDNRFTFAPTTGPNVNEVNGPNVYDNNNRLFTNKTGGGPIVDPIIPRGNGSTVNDMTGEAGTFSIGGTATNSLIVWYRNPYGLAQVKGYIDNTGANNITVQETFRLDTLGTFTKSTVVTPGSKLTLDPYDFTGTAIPAGSFQVYDYRADISGTTISGYRFFPYPCGVVST